MIELVEWAISVLDELGHDLKTGAESKAKIAARAHARAADLRKRLKEIQRDAEEGKWI